MSGQSDSCKDDELYASDIIKNAIRKTSSSSLDLSKKRLKMLTDDIYQASRIENLYLEGNELLNVPDDFFSKMPNLLWLDLRNNNLTSLPASIGQHCCLKTLLLEGNPIQKLPIELGNLYTLTALNLRNCPIEFPPEDVVKEGLQCILKFLRNEMKRISVNTIMPKEEIPEIEKLKLSELENSNLAVSDEWPNEEELLKFKTLKEQMMQDEEDMRNWVFPQLTPTVNMPLMNIKDNRKTKTLNATRKNGFLKRTPELHVADMHNNGKTEEKLAILSEEKKMQELLEQRKKDHDTLKDWREKTKNLQEKKQREQGFLFIDPVKRDKVPQSAPYATDPAFYCITNSQEHSNKKIHEQKGKQQNITNIKEAEDIRVARDKELENRIRSHIQMLQERRRKPKGTSQEEIAAIRKEMEAAERLKSDLLQRKMESDIPLEYLFTTFTGEHLPRNASY
ncbi:leucine-rich repeat-containing protein 27-like [Erpetoichthys calabaricus]|uniref:leucine-rich repeat-containing protein 27-like n=1 Tax=Erpetoichthys calabaricus TaxID=27687 RepID=UPI002234B2F3|nr:leucine-rich repeat-containing protein 27-like [Erpetoichthys calabaricus]XP_051778951.1 leucine-rich repeat-containing protein 27-like [Erpetoichthys calabaricus]